MDPSQLNAEGTVPASWSGQRNVDTDAGSFTCSAARGFLRIQAERVWGIRREAGSGRSVETASFSAVARLGCCWGYIQTLLLDVPRTSENGLADTEQVLVTSEKRTSTTPSPQLRGFLVPV